MTYAAYLLMSKFMTTLFEYPYLLGHFNHTNKRSPYEIFSLFYPPLAGIGSIKILIFLYQ